MGDVAASEGMDEIVKEFLAESAEGLDRLDRELIALESEPNSRERLDEIFRAVHTMKGSSGALGYPKLESVAHAGESLLSNLRDGKLALNAALTSGLLAMVDALRSLLQAIEQTGEEGSGDYSSVVGLLQELLVEPAGAPAIAFAAPRTSGENPTQNSSDTATVFAGTVRVDVGLLDGMMGLVGELVLAGNQAVPAGSSPPDGRLLSTALHVKSITRNLQDAVMKARMQPIANIWNQFPRLVRDLALQSGKQIVLEMEGGDTGLDRTIIEAIKDPLTHILRNAIDHGIETPEERARAGKTAEGHLRLHAFHEGGQVHVEISDDGRGIPLLRVRERALALGLLTAEQARNITEPELASLVFAPGFSTAEKVTNVSGRGVGLDVVKTNIERIGGTVELQTVTGRGTAIRLKVPLTLAILPALVVGCGGERFAIPQASLSELVLLRDEEGAAAIEQLCGTPVYRWRERLLPLVFLQHALRLAGGNSAQRYIIVLQANDRQFGLVVDAIYDTQDIVVKPLGRPLRNLDYCAGAAILADGRVVLVLDVLGLAPKVEVSGSQLRR